ncbi:hypothetical protein AB1K89_08250 [Sporosarcina sp. 179-K 8C2 HS]|uniref:hypothetical protein n=1 Tax=Sporosarcina sp. 179-K 8C2 HS TaxID=3142387 RepID=UPI0039A14858
MSQPICDLLETFPPSTTLSSIVVNGFSQPVTSLTTIDRERSLAFFSFAGSTVVVDCNRIALIEI